MKYLHALVIFMATASLASALQAERRVVVRNTFPHKGSFLPMAYPALFEGVMCLDDLKSIGLVAIVKPLGAPILEMRKGRFEKEISLADVMVVSQTFDVIDAIGTKEKQIESVMPVPIDGNRPFEGLKPLESNRHYLLFGAAAERQRIQISPYFGVSRIERFPEWQVHSIPVLSTGEFSGWSLVRTDSTKLPTTPSMEETALIAAADAVFATAPEVWHDAVRFLSRLRRHSLRTEGPFSDLNKRDESAKGDLIGRTQTDKYFAGTLSDYIIAKLPNVGSPRFKALLETLSNWGSSEAKRRLEARPPIRWARFRFVAR